MSPLYICMYVCVGVAERSRHAISVSNGSHIATSYI